VAAWLKWAELQCKSCFLPRRTVWWIVMSRSLWSCPL